MVIAPVVNSSKGVKMIMVLFNGNSIDMQSVIYVVYADNLYCLRL